MGWTGSGSDSTGGAGGLMLDPLTRLTDSAVTLDPEVSPRKPDYWGLTEIRDHLTELGKVNQETGEALSMPRVAALTLRRDFPKPVMNAARGRMWRPSEVHRWAEKWEQLPGKPPNRRENA